MRDDPKDDNSTVIDVLCTVQYYYNTTEFQLQPVVHDPARRSFNFLKDLDLSKRDGTSYQSHNAQHSESWEGKFYGHTKIK